MDSLRVKLHALLNSFANNVASPFISFNVTQAGGSDLLIGYVQAISTLASGTAQLVGGRVADLVGRRLRLAMFLSIVVGLLWLGAAAFPGTEALTLTYTGVTVALGFYLAGWNSFLGEATGIAGRGTFLATFARISSWGALAALLLTTAITYVAPTYTPLFLISGVAFIVSALFLRKQNETRVPMEEMTKTGFTLVRRYYATTAIYGLFWGFAWPLFTITSVRIVKMSLVEFSLSNLIAVASTIAFQALVGRMVDRNRRRSVFVGRLGLVAFPLGYMFFTQPWEIYAINVYSGFTNSLLNIAFSAYMYDLAPPGRRGRYMAEFNLVTGVATMAGSLLSAYLLTILSGGLDLWTALAILYLIAATGRLLAALLHLKL